MGHKAREGLYVFSIVCTQQPSIFVTAEAIGVIIQVNAEAGFTCN